MSNGKADVHLLLNGEERGHGHVVEKLLKQAKRLECLVAFAKASAVSDLSKSLEKALEKGLKCRIAIGLDFYLTEPEALLSLFALTKNHSFDLYISDASNTFHPKIYAFENGKGCSVIVGSANLTKGGLYDNFEASALVNDASGALMESVKRHLDSLVKDKILVPATKKRIAVYEREYIIHEILRKQAKTRAQKAIRTEGQNVTALAALFELMKCDTSDDGFAKQKAIREKDLRDSRRKLNDLATLTQNSALKFSHDYDELLDLFHSSGLQRGKNGIRSHWMEFVAALVDILDLNNSTPSEAFAVLHRHFENISGAGINLLTEILHALDNKRFAVMNRTAVVGLKLAGIHDYPLAPDKKNVSADSYAQYCKHADWVREELGLRDLSELDALFNYAYWKDIEVGPTAI